MKDETEAAPPLRAAGGSKATRDERLVQALRANLKRRKDQARGRSRTVDHPEEGGGSREHDRAGLEQDSG